MTITDVASTFASLESSMARDRGPFEFFALFQREDIPDRWDLVAAAPWIASDHDSAMKYFVDRIKSDVGPDGLTALSRIVFADPGDPAVSSISRGLSVEHSPSTEVRTSTFAGVPVRQAFIITSRRLGAPSGK